MELLSGKPPSHVDLKDIVRAVECFYNSRPQRLCWRSQLMQNVQFLECSALETVQRLSS